ncbi:MAG: alpha/beta hydrolase [Phycicoccus sp.]|nr:alpha/beta hydrolase [Phycicoccus sp.]
MSERHESGTIERDGASIAYIDQGEGTPVVLLPGMSLDISYLGRLADALAADGLRPVRVGSRQPPSDPDAAVTMHDLADDVNAVLTALDLPPAWVAGHAFGNRVARAVALDHPDRVAGVILLAAGGTVQPSPEASDALRIAFSDVPRDQGVKAMEYMVGDPADAESAYDAIMKASHPELGAMQHRATTDTPQDEWAALAPGKPVLIIQGTNDRMAPPANGEQLAKAAPDQVALAWIQGAGHLFAFLHPDQTAKDIVGYIKDHAG